MKIDTSAYNFNHLPDLTEEQKSNPFSKFYYEPVTDPEKEILDACGELPLCADDVLDFKDIRRIFEPDPGLKNGWCILPDGTGYTSLMTYMPQITPEIEAWWSSWMMDPACDYLNYRIWMPGLHESHAMPIMENLGWGTLCIHMEKPLFPPMLLGTQNPKDIDPGYLMEMGSAGCSVLKADPNGERFYSVLISCIKKAIPV